MSTMLVAGVLGVDGPLPEAPAHNLFTVAHAIGEQAPDGGIQFWPQVDDARPLAGVIVVPYPLGPPFLWDPCSSGTLRLKEEGRDLPTGRQDNAERTFLPFVAYVGDVCTSFAIGEWDRWKDRANRVILASEAWAAERQLANGDGQSQNPYFLDSNGTTLGSGAVGPVEGLALLENAIGHTARKGVIHATPAIATMWASNRLLLWDRDEAVTVATRTPVVVGYGYIGLHHAGSDQEYAFASGPIGIARSDLIENDTELAVDLDRAHNEIVYRAEREMVVAWDTTLQVNVLIDRSQTP